MTDHTEMDDPEKMLGIQRLLLKLEKDDAEFFRAFCVIVGVADPEEFIAAMKHNVADPEAFIQAHGRLRELRKRVHQSTEDAD